MLRGALEPWHIIIIVALLFVLFGAKRMPDASRSLARSMKIFKSEIKDLRTDDEDETVTPEIAATPDATKPVASPRSGATAVTVPAATTTVVAPATVETSTADEVALREAELHLAEARVNELRARAAAESERTHDRV